MGRLTMKKEITIGFRTDKEIRNALEKIAGEKRLSVSAVIESILYERMKELKALQGLARDQRKFARKPVSLPAFIMNTKSNAQHFQTGKVLDISLGGMRLSIPQGLNLEVSTDNGSNQFRIVFTLPEATRPINVTCQSKRVYEYGENIHIGAAFVDSDFSSYQTLQKYLI